MIQQPAQNTMVTNNTNESSSFSIDVSSGKAYQILADGIYRYKIAAIVRELMANCSDSHVDAGCREKPFRIKRPGQTLQARTLPRT